MVLYQIPSGFTKQTIAMRGAAGRAWIDQLPATVSTFARRWSLTMLPPFPNLSYNYVVPATRADGTPAVLKIGFPADNEIKAERAALELAAGRGLVRLLAADPGQSVMLLERVTPGAPLTTLADDEAATRVAATVMGQLWQPVPSAAPFPSTADWGAGFGRMRRHFGGGGPIPRRLAERGERLFAELIQSQAAPVLLHGDLHHDNILAARRQPWLAIDPKGVTGEPAYEPGAFLRNPGDLLSRPDAHAITLRRLAVFAEMLALDRQRLRQWAVAQAVLSAWWMIEDNAPDLARAIALAELFDGIAPRDR